MAKMGGKSCVANYFLSFSPILMKFGTDVCLGMEMCKTHFFDSGRKCVAMVTAYYGKNGGKILRRELLPQFFTNYEIWHRCLPWGVDVQDTFFWQWQKVCCHGNGIWQKWGENLAMCCHGKSILWQKNLASLTTSSVFEQFSWNLAQMFALGCRCARCIFRPWQKVRCHGNSILRPKFGENWRFCYFYILKAFRVKFCPRVGREVMCEIHSLTMVESVLPW